METITMEVVETTNLHIKWGSMEYNEWVEQGRPINATIKELDISNLKINSLIGLEKLTNLTYLWCHNNQLTSLEGL